MYAAGFGVLIETDRFEKLRASAHAALATYAQDPEAADEAWTLAEPLPAALIGHREGQGGRRLLRPALDPIAGGGRRPKDCGSSTGRSGFARRRPPRTTSAAPSASSARATWRAGTARIKKPAGSSP